MQRWLAVTVLGLMCYTGCGRSGPEMADFSGTVTYKGEPIKDGSIKMIPESGTIAPVTPVQIKDGNFSATGERGIIVGKYRLEFHSYQRITEGAGDGAQEGVDIPGMYMNKELLPEKYSAKSTEMLDIPAGSGSVQKDFKLE